MSYSIVYIVNSNGRDEHADMALASMISVRISNPDLRIVMLCDEISANNIREKKLSLLEVCNELIPIATPEGSGAFKNRWIKTQLPRFVQGDMLYLDSDTLVRLPFGKLPEMVKEVGMVANHNESAIAGQFWDEDRAVFRKMDWTIPLINRYYNGGVIFIKECSASRQFFECWHDLWSKSLKFTGRVRDQPSLNQALVISHVKISELPTCFNAQIPSGWDNSHNAVVWHFYSSENNKSPTSFDKILSSVSVASMDSLRNLIANVILKAEPWSNSDIVARCIQQKLTLKRRPTIPETHWLNGDILKSILHYLYHKLPFSMRTSSDTKSPIIEDVNDRCKGTYRVVVSSPTLELSGANVFLVKLLNHLHLIGVESDWVITHHNPEINMEWLGDYKFRIHQFPKTKVKEIRKRQNLMLEFLKCRQPCIYMPNYDADMICILPALTEEVRPILILHSDDPFYYDLARNFGGYCDKIVAVSCSIYSKLLKTAYSLKSRLRHISYGVDRVPTGQLRKKGTGLPLRVAYCGRISKVQKRVQDLAAIINRCDREGLPIEFHIAGTGVDEEEFSQLVSAAKSKGIVVNHGFLSNAQTLELLDKSDVIIMTSEYEGQSIVLLEAMSRGCIPLVTSIDSGVDELIINKSTGFMLPVGDIEGFIEILRELSLNLYKVIRISKRTSSFLANSKYTIDRAAHEYHSLFQSIITNLKVNHNRRLKRPIFPSQYKVINRLKKKMMLKLSIS